MSRFRSGDEDSNLESIQVKALLMLQLMYRRFRQSNERVIDSEVLLSLQRSCVGVGITKQINGIIPSLLIPAKFLISKYWVDIQLADVVEAQQVRRSKEEIWPGIEHLEVLYKREILL